MGYTNYIIAVKLVGYTNYSVFYISSIGYINCSVFCFVFHCQVWYTNSSVFYLLSSIPSDVTMHEALALSQPLFPMQLQNVTIKLQT